MPTTAKDYQNTSLNRGVSENPPCECPVNLLSKPPEGEETSQIELLQKRIDYSLRQSREDWRNSNFVPFGPHSQATVYMHKFYYVAREPWKDKKNIEAVKVVLDEFDDFLKNGIDKVQLQDSLMSFLVHHPAVAELNLYIPSLEERSPWKVDHGMHKAVS